MIVTPHLADECAYQRQRLQVAVEQPDPQVRGILLAAIRSALAGLPPSPALIVGSDEL